MARGKTWMRTVAHVQRFSGPGPNGGAYYNVYTYDDDSMKTIEFTRAGAHLHEYDGEPRVLGGEAEDKSEDKSEDRAEEAKPIVPASTLPTKPTGPPPK